MDKYLWNEVKHTTFKCYWVSSIVTDCHLVLEQLAITTISKIEKCAIILKQRYSIYHIE